MFLAYLGMPTFRSINKDKTSTNVRVVRCVGWWSHNLKIETDSIHNVMPNYFWNNEVWANIIRNIDDASGKIQLFWICERWMKSHSEKPLQEFWDEKSDSRWLENLVLSCNEMKVQQKSYKAFSLFHWEKRMEIGLIAHVRTYVNRSLDKIQIENHEEKPQTKVHLVCNVLTHMQM